MTLECKKCLFKLLNGEQNSQKNLPDGILCPLHTNLFSFKPFKVS